ncbi:MAG: DNA repair protein RecO [Burkholderiales bacterium]|nr:DNA repair protein RecO [Burkholderiales bacterium]
MKPRSAPTPAFVLHRYDWSETSLILDLFTRERGRVTVAAKGAKRPYSQLRPVLLPFQRLLALLSQPKGDEPVDIFTLRSAEWAGGAPMLQGAALFSGFYLNELLIRLMPRGDAHAVLFDAYAHTLPALALADPTLTPAALRAFEVVLLRELGLLPQLDRTGNRDQRLDDDGLYMLRPELGVLPFAHGDAPIPGRTLRAMQDALDQGDLPALQSAAAQALPSLKLTLRQWLHYHLGSARLRTREVMLASQQLVERPDGPVAAPEDSVP